MQTRASYNFSKRRHTRTKPPDSGLHVSKHFRRHSCSASLRAGFGAFGRAHGRRRAGMGTNANGSWHTAVTRRRSCHCKPQLGTTPSHCWHSQFHADGVRARVGDAYNTSKAGALPFGRALGLHQRNTKTPVVDAGDQLSCAFARRAKEISGPHYRLGQPERPATQPGAPQLRSHQSARSRRQTRAVGGVPSTF